MTNAVVIARLKQVYADLNERNQKKKIRSFFYNRTPDKKGAHKTQIDDDKKKSH